MNEMMTTQEVADYLRVRQRKIYELVRLRRIPCSRITGKWLFPKAMIDLWVLQNAETLADAMPVRPPPLILGGSHDPLLEWAVHQSDCGLAQLACGSLEGLARLARGDVMAAGCHVYEAETKTFNQATAQRLLVGHGMVLITWAWRRQGLIVAAGNPLGLSSLADLAPTDGPRPRLVTRQAAAGSTILLRHLAEVAGIDGDSLNSGAVPARTHSDMAAAILRGEADAGLGVEAAAAPFGLDFVPLFRERFDLAMRRRDYFADPVQRLLAFAGGPQFDGHAAGLHGYDTGELGRVVWNDR